MQVQRFRSQSVRGALSAVKASLGPEALVLSTQLVPARGWRRLVGQREVEVTASLTPVMVGGKMIARGEVVVVEGNYGVRVTEILSTADRIRSLGA